MRFAIERHEHDAPLETRLACLARRGAVALVMAGGLAAMGSAVAGETAGKEPGAGPSGAIEPASAGLEAAFAAGDVEEIAARVDDRLFASLAGEVDPSERPSGTLADLRASLDPTTALLALCSGDEVVYALLVRHDDVVARKLDAPGLRVMAARLERWAADADRWPYDPLAGVTLHHLLISPLRSDLTGVRRVIVAAAGDVATIPFDALLTMEIDERDADTRPYVMRRYSITWESTLFSRLAWTNQRTGISRLEAFPATADAEIAWDPGDLVVVQAAIPDPGNASAAAIRLAAGDARGALMLVGAPADEEAGIAPETEPTARGGSDVRAVQAIRRALMNAGEPPETWARWRLYGCKD
ncbi:MAG: hypothetical protein R3B81_00425 [bacterium]